MLLILSRSFDRENTSSALNFSWRRTSCSGTSVIPVSLISPTLNCGPSTTVTVTFTVVEGPQFKVGEIKLTGITLVPEQEVRRQLKFKAEDVFSRSKLRESIRSIENLYGTIGRASVDIVPKTEQVPGQNIINITFDITEGPEVVVERINISGNVRSQDKILRREIPLHEGDLYTLQKKERARQKLVNLGYF